jgi:hypothetical protein
VESKRPGGAGLIASSSNPIMQNVSERIELVSSNRSRNLSIGDHCARSYHFVIAVWRAKEHNPWRKLLEYHR